MRVAALVPARAGSKGIPGKNRREYAGFPLWLLAVNVGRGVTEEVYVSTDDPTMYDHGIITIGRPAELARDDTPMLAVVQHAMPYMENPDVVLLLQPTQPLREEYHVRTALLLLDESGADSVVSVVEIPQTHSQDYVGHLEDGFLRFPEATRRQDCRPDYYRDGTVYAISRETIEAGSLYGERCLPLVIPVSESCTLDTEEDWARLMAREVACV